MYFSAVIDFIKQTGSKKTAMVEHDGLKECLELTVHVFSSIISYRRYINMIALS